VDFLGTHITSAWSSFGKRGVKNYLDGFGYSLGSFLSGVRREFLGTKTLLEIWASYLMFLVIDTVLFSLCIIL
jgi:hypothetical protein